MKPILIYCYDAWCGWCYGFSKVITEVEREFRGRIDFEVLSGGMILPQQPRHIRAMAPYIQTAYKTVEERTGIKFGEDFLWHIFNFDESDWFPNSEKSAIALCVLKEHRPESQIQIASDLQYSLNFEGRDLTDDEAYRHLLEKYDIPVTEFYARLKAPEYKEKAYYEFALTKQLQVTGFPAVFIQVNESKFYLIARGYTEYSDLKESIEQILQSITTPSSSSSSSLS